MRALRDLSGGLPPIPMELFYNGEAAQDSVTLRYKGSLVRVMDYDVTTNGLFLTWAGELTRMENIFGILEEEQPTSGNYLPNSTTYGMTRRKITPILPSTLIRAEYSRIDPTGEAIVDTGANCTLGSTDFTIHIDTKDTMLGGWIYMLDGDERYYLHYIRNSTVNKIVFATAANRAIGGSDTFLAIQPAITRRVDFDDHYVHLVSEVDDGEKIDPIVGLDHWITAPGLPMQRLDRNIHDNIRIPDARFYHDFVLPGNQLYTNVFTYGIKES